MNIYELCRLCNLFDMIEVIDYKSKKRLYFGYIKNVPYHKKWIIKYITIYEKTLVVCIKDLNKIRTN